MKNKLFMSGTWRNSKSMSESTGMIASSLIFMLPRYGAICNGVLDRLNNKQPEKTDNLLLSYLSSLVLICYTTSAKKFPQRLIMENRENSIESDHEPGVAPGFTVPGLEGEEDDIHNTLYELTQLQEYTARKVVADDIQAIRKLLKDEDYSQFKFEDPVILFETCCFSLAVSDVIESDRLVAAAFFDDKPATANLMKNSKKWKNQHDMKNMTPINTLHMRLFVCNPEVAEDVCLTEIISNTFSSCAHMDYIIVEMADMNYTGPYAFSPLVKEIVYSPAPRQKRKIIVYKKDLLMPHLLVREGREHDLDDLVPLLPLDTATIEAQFGKSNLSDIIAMSDKSNQSMVAEWKNEAVGIISVSADIDYELLNKFFHLEPFHGLHKPHPYDEVYIDDDSTKPVVDVEFDGLFKEAERNLTNRGIRIHRQEEAIPHHPYDIELIKEFSMCDDVVSENDSSVADKLDDKIPRPHQFTTKVSEDIILYGLRTRSPDEMSNSGTPSSRSKSLLNAASSRFAGDTLLEEIELEGDEDEEEEHEEGEGLEEEDELLQILDGDDLVMPSDHKQAVAASVGDAGKTELETEGSPVEGGERDETLIGADGEEIFGEGSEEGLNNEEGMRLIGSTATGEVGEENGDAEDVSGFELVPAPKDKTMLEVSGGVEDDADDHDVSSPPHRVRSISESLSVSDVSGYLEASISKTDVEEESTVAQGPTVAFMVESRKLQSKSHFDQKSIVQLQQLSPEVRRRLSEDTLYVGKRLPPRNFDQKVELFKKVWDVYNMIQDDGMTLEQAKDMMSPADIDALEEAHVTTTGCLLKFITALLPDESKYPLQRPLITGKSIFRGIANALAIKLFNNGKKYICRNADMFRDIFRTFPNREYLIVAVPVGVREPAWLDNFIRVIPKAESSYPRDLFLLHKSVITSKLRVRRARERDMSSIKNFIATLLEKDKIFKDYLQSFSKPHESTGPKLNCYIAEVKNYEGIPVVGLAIVSTEEEPLKYLVNYDLEKHTYYSAHGEETFGYVHHFILNPIFQRHGRLFLKEVMRLEDKECLFHRVYQKHAQNASTEHQSILNNMEDWVPLMPRKRIHYEDLKMTDAYDDERQPPTYVQNTCDPYALIHTAKKFVMEPKISLTKRIVFVGASTTTISCLEKLISSTFRSFKHLTVIDPFGLPGALPPDPVRNEFFSVRNGGVKMSYESDSEWAQRLGIHLWVQVVVGRVTSIVRDAKYVVVNSEYVVPYDKLILAPGQQFQRLDCPEPEINDPNFMAFKKNTATHELQDTKNLKFNRDFPKPKNVFMINNEVEADIALEFLRMYKTFMKKKKVIVFGGGLITYACVKALLAFGIAADKIVMISTPDREIEWEKKQGYTLSSKVRNPMTRELRNLGVYMMDNYEFSHWETCSISGLVKRSHFKSLTERDAHISFSTFALFCYRYKRVDDGIVSALSEAYLLYQDGIVIDGNFKTNDPNIYAAGPAASYQKILLADRQNHIYYQSEEIGYKLAEFLIESSGVEGGGQGKLEDFNVIRFNKPLIRAIKLPGDWYYLYLRSPGSHARCNDFHGTSCQETCECTTEVVTGSVNYDEDNTQRFFKIRLDDRSRIVSLECMSKSAFSFSNLSALYGQHETLLNKMMERLEKGETTCLYDHFCQSWFAVFCIDEWDNFVQELNDLYKEHDIGDGIKLVEFIRDFISNLDNPDAVQMDPNIIRSVWRSSRLKQMVEEKLLNFLKFHRLALPMYAHHHFVEDLLEERSISTLYYPNTKAHMQNTTQPIISTNRNETSFRKSKIENKLTKGIPLSPLPSGDFIDHNVPHAPVRKVCLSANERKLAVKNALRYFPKDRHDSFQPEFEKELETYGHIYMYRFTPRFPLRAYPIDAYPAKIPEARAVMLMIFNNLDPAVAQFPQELVTYGGNGQVFSNWAQFWLVMKYLSEMDDSQTLSMYSGHPLGLFPSRAGVGPRVVITNGMVVPNYSKQEDYDKFFALNVTMYGQMTAGSYCYIGPQGIVHGTTITLLNAGRKYLQANTLKGKVFVSSGLGGMSGAQAKAACIAGCIGVIAELSWDALKKRHEQGWVLEISKDLDQLIPRIREARKNGEVTSIGIMGMLSLFGSGWLLKWRKQENFL
ncbi:Urocanate hydratase [Orchesella cincta]|uniref:Urocanate hydratase n=1 Tax=Orchesella cincta TaxID=48709 RepID=A0A1D2NC71_ORCCI|nr:Urocanate hydratase [Orchesella cincta]